MGVMRRGGPSMAEEIAWFVGIDWASQSHQVCLVDARGECLGERAVAHGGPGIEELCDWLIARTGAAPTVYGRRTYSGRPSSSMRLSEAIAMATSVVCRPSVRERSASPTNRL